MNGVVDRRISSMTRRIFIVTNRDDLHADIVARKIANGGGSPFRLNLEEFPAHFTVTLENRGAHWNGALYHVPTGDSLPLGDIGAVWMRKKAPFGFMSAQMGAQEKAYAVAETEHVLFSLLYSLDAYWMSHPAAARGAIWKGEQLIRAARMGFATPPSLVTNRRASVHSFGNAAPEGLVFKSMSPMAAAAEELSPDQRVALALPTTLLQDSDETLLDSVEELPTFFQHCIPKAYELRVTVVGERLFAAKIHSQDDARTSIDYRDFSVEIPYEAAILPPEIERRCIAFVHSYGLTFGALDLIVTPAGEYVFLENNPVGQFLFVEELVPQLKITDAVAECLIEGAAGRRPPR